MWLVDTERTEGFLRFLEVSKEIRIVRAPQERVPVSVSPQCSEVAHFRESNSVVHLERVGYGKWCLTSVSHPRLRDRWAQSKMRH